jgi:hypothetical protein
MQGREGSVAASAYVVAALRFNAASKGAKNHVTGDPSLSGHRHRFAG